MEAVIKKKSKGWNENIMKVLYRCDADPGKTKTPDSPAINQVWTQQVSITCWVSG